MSLKILHMPHASEERLLNNAPAAFKHPLYSANPCATCPGHCCKHMVAISTVEMFRMAFQLSVPLASFAEAVQPPASILKTTRMPIIPLAAGPTLIRLRRHEPAWTCMFLVDVGGLGRCGVYSIRPNTCRLYPFHILADGEELRSGNQQLCPTRWLQSPHQEAPLLKAYRQRRADHRTENRLIAAWSRATGLHGSWDEYVAFSRTRLNRRFPEFVPPVAPERRRLGQGLVPDKSG